MKLQQHKLFHSINLSAIWCKACMVVAISLTCSPVWSESPAQLIERVEIPPDTRVKIISTDAAYNNVQMAMATLSSTSSVESLLNYYRSAWAVEDATDIPAFIESQIPGWYLISKLEDRNNVVVQIGDSGPGGSKGFISVMTIDQQMPSVPHGPFTDLTPLTSNRSVDGVDVSLMRVYGSNASISATHGNLRKRLVREGWKVMMDTQVQGSRVLILSRGSSRLEVSFVRSSHFASAVVVHQLTSG